MKMKNKIKKTNKKEVAFLLVLLIGIILQKILR
jgi:hypothetical protein